MVFSATYILPVVTSIIYQDGTLSMFLNDMSLTFMAGLLLWGLNRKYERELKTREGFIIVVVAWLGMAGFATLPLMSYLPDLSFTDAYFY